MKFDVLKLAPDFPDEFAYKYNKTALEIVQKKFDIEKLANDVFAISNNEMSFFVIYDDIDKCWNSSIENELNFKKEKFEEISTNSFHQFVALNCLHTALADNARLFLKDNVNEILDKIMKKR